MIPLMVIASSWYNLSFASPGDDRIGAQALIRDTRTTDQWSFSEKILSLPSADEAMDPSRVFLTVKTNAIYVPWSHLVISFARKTRKFLSMTHPESNSLVSRKATTSIYSLLSSISMISILRT